METQLDYESQVYVAVYASEKDTASVWQSAPEMGVHLTRVQLAPGEYAAADRRLVRNTRSALRWAVVGAVAGALVGVGLSLLWFGPAFAIAVWLAVACAAGGAVIGGLIGVQISARYDQDVARTVKLTPGCGAVVLRAQANIAAPGHANLRECLERGRPIAFLDVPALEACQQDQAKVVR